MKERFEELLNQMDRHQDCMLVTVVGGRGSAPRGAGAQMLAGAQGRLAGTIGGGSMEHTALELARTLLEKKESRLQEFRLHQTAIGDIGMICGGDVQIWFQYIPAEDGHWRKLVTEVLACFREMRPGWLVQDLRGGHPFLTESAPGGESLFAMPLPLGERAVIFGGGHISRALVPLLKTVGFRPVIFDCRPDYARPGDFPGAEVVVCGDYSAIDQYLTIGPEDYVVVMTNGHTHDFEVQRQLLDRELAYIGVIGSQKKTAALNQRLLESGISQESVKRVHSPIGTRIKAVTPEEIAVSIAGEMIYERALRRETGEGHGCPMMQELEENQ